MCSTLKNIDLSKINTNFLELALENDCAIEINPKSYNGNLELKVRKDNWRKSVEVDNEELINHTNPSLVLKYIILEMIHDVDKAIELQKID